MFESITQFFRRFKKSEKEESKSTAKERLHLVLAQDRAKHFGRFFGNDETGNIRSN